MKYLLDTHTFFWSVTNVPKLPDRVQELITDGQNELGVSIASFWEMAIKSGIGKWDLRKSLVDFGEYARSEHIAIVPITVDITEILRSLPQHHGDPFDRMIIATAINQSYTIISKDAAFNDYQVDRIW